MVRNNSMGHKDIIVRMHESRIRIRISSEGHEHAILEIWIKK